MSELRLVPAAVAVWAASLIVIVTGTGLACAAVAVLALMCLLARQAGQAILVAGLGIASTVVATLRCRSAAAWHFGDQIRGTVSGQPKHVETGSWIVRLRIDGHPSTLTVFAPDLPEGIVPGASVTATGRIGESGVPSVNPYVFNGQIDLDSPPQGFAAVAEHVRTTFAEAVAAQVGPGTKGLIPGMVLGDTTGQTATDQQAYIDTGLSHLSAVSGSNVAIVTTAAVVAATLLGLGLRLRLIAAAGALLGFAALVGPEPSVLRASVTGLVGLVAVLASTRTEPIHALCLSIIGLVLVDSDLAVHYGFALSVAATAGIVALSPLLYRALAVTGWPDILVRALSVALAADVVTMPIVALMAGRVSLISAAANVLVAPVTAPITVLGLVAAALSLIPGSLEAPLLFVIEPLAWWVHTIATVGASLPIATAPVRPVTALVAYGWILAGIIAKRPRLTAAMTLAALCLTHTPTAPVIDADVAQLRPHVVATKTGIEPVPPGTQLVVVLESGRPPKRPTMTQDGIPVIFPNKIEPGN